MSTKFIDKCPVCGGDLSITSLGCKKCGIEIKGDFESSLDNNYNTILTDEEKEFVKLFLKYEGNFTKVQEELEIGYAAIKAKIRNLNIKLGNEVESDMPINVQQIETNDKGPASKKIIERLSRNGGIAECRMLRGEPLKIWLTKEGVRNSGFPDLVCEWRILDAIVEKARALGGKMYRGDGASQNGAKIGSKELPLDTIDAFISVEFYGNQVGRSTLRRSTYFAAILAWAEICKNMRSDGKGGYIILYPEWR